MATIQEVLSAGNGISVGPVKINKIYDKKSPKAPLFLLCEDASGKGAIKLWGDASNGRYNEGDSITIQIAAHDGKLVVVTDNSNRQSIDANGCQVLVGDAGQPATPAPKPPAPQIPASIAPDAAAPAAKAVLNDMECAFQAFTVCNHVLHFAHKAGWPEDKAFDLAIAAMDSPSKLWFGEKYPATSTDAFAILNPYKQQ